MFNSETCPCPLDWATPNFLTMSGSLVLVGDMDAVSVSAPNCTLLKDLPEHFDWLLWLAMASIEDRPRLVHATNIDNVFI